MLCLLFAAWKNIHAARETETLRARVPHGLRRLGQRRSAATRVYGAVTIAPLAGCTDKHACPHTPAVQRAWCGHSPQRAVSSRTQENTAGGGATSHLGQRVMRQNWVVVQPSARNVS